MMIPDNGYFLGHPVDLYTVLINAVDGEIWGYYFRLCPP